LSKVKLTEPSDWD